MNLFILDYLPVQAAEYNCDSHVRKIILEAVEMMGYTYNHGKGFKPWPWIYRHRNHPMSLWVRESRQNFDWTLQHAYALCNEFQFRFNKKHKCLDYLNWISANLPIDELPDIGQTDWPRCFGNYRDVVGVTEDAVYDYRRYYMMAKKRLAVWTKREIPYWYRFI